MCQSSQPSLARLSVPGASTGIDCSDSLFRRCRGEVGCLPFSASSRSACSIAGSKKRSSSERGTADVGTPDTQMARKPSRSAIDWKLSVKRCLLAVMSTAEGGAVESEGDLIIFDMDWKDVGADVGNTKVFCQDASKFNLEPVDALDTNIRAALDTLLAKELK